MRTRFSDRVAKCQSADAAFSWAGRLPFAISDTSGLIAFMLPISACVLELLLATASNARAACTCTSSSGASSHGISG